MCKKQEYHRGLKLCLNYIRKKYLCFLFLIKSKTKKKRGKKTMAEEKTANTPKRNYEKRERTTRTSKTTQEGRPARTTRRTTKQTRPYHKNKVERIKKESEVSTKKEEKIGRASCRERV